MLIRKERPQDYKTVYSVVKEAFESAEHSDGNEQDLVAALRKGDVTCPRQHRHLKRKDSIRFLVLLVFSNFYIYTGCRKGTRSRQPHPRKDLFKSS